MIDVNNDVVQAVMHFSEFNYQLLRRLRLFIKNHFRIFFLGLEVISIKIDLNYFISWEINQIPDAIIDDIKPPKNCMQSQTEADEEQSC